MRGFPTEKDKQLNIMGDVTRTLLKTGGVCVVSYRQCVSWTEHEYNIYVADSMLVN